MLIGSRPFQSRAEMRWQERRLSSFRAAVPRLPRQRHPWMGWIVAMCAPVALFAGGFLQFVADLPRQSPVSEPADAIVVLTGGGERLTSALGLLAEGKGQRLLISGVNPGTTRDDLEILAGPDHEDAFACCIDLDYVATSTSTNANETALWTLSNDYDRLIVVTAAYHMPRSLAELKARLPDTMLIANPVFPQTVDLTRWWASPKTLRLLVTEYTKYIASLVRLRLGPPLR